MVLILKNKVVSTYDTVALAEEKEVERRKTVKAIKVETVVRNSSNRGKAPLVVTYVNDDESKE